MSAITMIAGVGCLAAVLAAAGLAGGGGALGRLFSASSTHIRIVLTPAQQVLWARMGRLVWKALDGVDDGGP